MSEHRFVYVGSVDALPSAYWQRVETAEAAFRTADVRLGCRHVVRGGALGGLCAAHPAAGLMCARCQVRHVDRHTDFVEKCCDGCGVIVDALYGGVVFASTGTSPLRVVDTGGYARRLDHAEFVIGSLGLCAQCRPPVPEGLA
jgi:hypothetical protein